jgi:cytochrome c
MNTMEVNKLLAALLVAGITFAVAGLIGDALVQVTPLKESAIRIEEPAGAGAAPAAAPEAPPPVANLMASADTAAGESIVKKVCAACHTVVQGGKPGVGPNLYGVVGSPHGGKADYAYSSALKDKAGPWTFDELNTWLTKPAAYAPGTKMAFPGLPKPQDRANVIDYLRTLSPNPEPRPTPVVVAAAAAAAPAKEASLAELLRNANVARGQADTLKNACIACHTFNEGGKAGVGPNLYNVVGGPRAHMAGFDYSAGLKAKTGDWTYESLNEWLTKPAAYVPGTKMLLAGVPSAQDRADIIAYLRSLSPNPIPLP